MKPRANYNNLENVINHSDHTLSEHELRILSNGLEFVPTPANVNKTGLITDIKQWGRRMRLREYFADKGAAVAVQNKRDYLTEAYKQLNGTDKNGNKVFKHVASDPTSDFVIRVKETVQDAHSKGVINTSTAEYLVMENAQPGNIYFLPKIYKPQRPPPARPICNTIKSATTNISKWIDDQLQPLVEKLPSHIKDNNNFVCKLVELNKGHTLPPETTLVTWDVKSLYTNIPHDGGSLTLAALNGTPQEIENIKKGFCKVFRDNDLKITVEANITKTNFLDVTLDLSSGKYYPFTKEGNIPLYVHKKSNHPPSILRNIPESINRRLSEISSDRECFDSAKPIYQEALKKSGYSYTLSFNAASNQAPRPRRNRQRNITWFNPPYSKNVETNVGKCFLALIDKHFTKTNPLHKIFNRNTLKLSYSCMGSIKTVISNHNKSEIRKLARANDRARKSCNCRKPDICPMDGNCNMESIIYQAEVTTETAKETYIGLCDTAFKMRYRNHLCSFRNERYRHATELSKYIWSLKDKDTKFNIKWRKNSRDVVSMLCAPIPKDRTTVHVNLDFQGTDGPAKRFRAAKKCMTENSVVAWLLFFLARYHFPFSAMWGSLDMKMELVHQNIRGLLNKLDEIRYIINTLKSGIQLISFTETWLNSSVLDEEVNIPGYTVFRKDRGSKGGGVIVYAGDDLSVNRRSDLERPDVEGLWLEIPLPKCRSFHFGTFYRPPSSSKHTNPNFMSVFSDAIESLSVEDKEVLVLGDFNCDFSAKKTTQPECKQMKRLLKSLSFSQLITSPTRIASES
ncbi:hypothetical protein AWC38_SpisGene12938 [Stylophora pistillata]|uniref:Helix-turn-helix domain-containing protein n=1 Tax=Stylophora pistillata TaxID=50429 RepID=A0A2B4S0G3_STYPI|nr:hypothetical protein AWC38_SpisGene12938 [Stylophora pistillata]